MYVYVYMSATDLPTRPYKSVHLCECVATQRKKTVNFNKITKWHWMLINTKLNSFTLERVSLTRHLRRRPHTLACMYYKFISVYMYIGMSASLLRAIDFNMKVYFDYAGTLTMSVCSHVKFLDPSSVGTSRETNVPLQKPSIIWIRTITNNTPYEGS